MSVLVPGLAGALCVYAAYTSLSSAVHRSHAVAAPSLILAARVALNDTLPPSQRDASLLPGHRGLRPDDEHAAALAALLTPAELARYTGSRTLGPTAPKHGVSHGILPDPVLHREPTAVAHAWNGLLAQAVVSLSGHTEL